MERIIKRLLLSLLLSLMLACASLPPLPTPRPPTAAPTLNATPDSARTAAAGTDGLPTPTRYVPAQPLAPFSARTNAPFASQVNLAHAVLPSNPVSAYSLPISLDKIANNGLTANFTAAQTSFLIKNGFVVLHTQEAQFGDIRRRASDQYGQPYYLTTDAGYHALHLSFSELLMALERERLRPQMIAVTNATLQQVRTYQLSNNTGLAAAYLAVALKLFDPQAELDPDLENRIQPQLDQIRTGGGPEKSRLIPGFEDDYSAYRPVGHYAGDAALSAYFQGMTWFGRVSLILQDSAKPGFTPDLTPLILTLALRQARLPADPSRPGEITLASDEWTRVHEILSYLIGPSPDSGPLELASLMDKIYGTDAPYTTLDDAALLRQFVQRSSELPAAQVNSTFAPSTSTPNAQRSWRFMGQRFVLDSFILQNMVFDKVGSTDRKRLLPSGLDVMAALGSQPALNAQEKAGETSYENYLEQMAMMQKAVNSQSEGQWLNPLYSGWLYAFLPQIAPKSAAFPAAMRSPAWGSKDLNTALGSWAELKNDTALYTRIPQALSIGGPPRSGPAPAYVEPQPDVFYRLAYIANSVVKGLEQRSVTPSPILGEPAWSPGPLTLEMLLYGMQQLGETFQKLGQIAENELSGSVPTSPEEWALIQGCLGPVECAVRRSEMYPAPVSMPPVPVITAFSGAGAQTAGASAQTAGASAQTAGAGGDAILEAATGAVDRIFVLIPGSDAKLQLAQGGVYSYYEFLQPRAGRLTDTEWRTRLIDDPPAQPPWTANFVLPGGKLNETLAMRVGDVYKMLAAGGEPPLNMRGTPSRTVLAVAQLATNEYFSIVDGPLRNEGLTWWLVRKTDASLTQGWIVENTQWYERAYGQ
jgi:hypothetical protein